MHLLSVSGTFVVLSDVEHQRSCVAIHSLPSERFFEIFAPMCEIYARIPVSSVRMTQKKQKNKVMDGKIVFLATVSGCWWRLLAGGWE